MYIFRLVTKKRFEIFSTKFDAIKSDELTENGYLLRVFKSSV